MGHKHYTMTKAIFFCLLLGTLLGASYAYKEHYQIQEISTLAEVQNKKPFEVKTSVMVLSINDFLKWNSNDFFNRPDELSLCKAIASRDMAKLESLINSGADVNATGKFGINALYWAMIEGNMNAFEFLLKHGADPDRTLTEDIVMKPGRYNVFLSGDSVFFTALRSMKPEYATAALPYSRNVHQTDRGGYNMVQIFLYHGYGFGGKKHLPVFIAAGIDLNGRNLNPCRVALMFNRADLCLQMLKGGADPAVVSEEDQLDLADDVEHSLWCEKPGEHDTRLDPLISWFNENYREIRLHKP